MDGLPTSLAELREELVVHTVMLESVVEQLQSGAEDLALRADRVAIKNNIRKLKKRIQRLQQEARTPTPGKTSLSSRVSRSTQPLALVFPGVAC